jgi:DNA-binding NarL/FixJ family response regulator
MIIDIILAEDHNIVRNGIRSLLEKEDDFNISGEAVNGRQVLELLDKGKKADIVLADMNMPEMGGMELTEHIKKSYPDSKVIILSALDHEKYVIKAFQANASGYMLKSVSAEELVFSIKHVCAGNQYICSELTTKFLKRLLTIPDPASLQPIHDIELSAKEIEVLGLITEGYTNQEISDKIFASKRTIESLRQNLIDKTGSRNTAALVRYAIVNGIVN